MFYSTEVLTSRKYGVATVWLLATMGSKSTLKKVSRKAILDVDVTKACETIVAPDAPMALRLQSNLLYGLARAYSQQCGYVLNDAEAARNSMRAMFKVIEQAGLEPEGVNKARADQLILQDDPNFMPDLDMMPIDLDNLNLNINVNEDTQITLSPYSSQSQLVNGSQESIGGLNIPPSNSSRSFAGGAVGGLDLFRVRGDSGPGTATRSAPQLLEDDDLGLVLGDDFGFVAGDGSVRQSRAPSGRAYMTDPASEGRVYSVQPDQPMLPDDGYIVQDNGFNFAGDHTDGAAAYAQGEVQDESQQETIEEENIMAPARRQDRKPPKVIEMDGRTTLSNQDLASWSRNYLETMREQGQKKQALKMKNIAKKNAEHWMLGVGNFLGQGMRAELNMFVGADLLEAFTGINLITGAKRLRPQDDEPGSGRSKRSRAGSLSDEAGRGFEQEQDDFMPMYGGDTIEQGREAPTPLDERQHSSIFPWNQSAGSRRPTDGHPTSASFGGGGIQLNVLGRRGSRLTSASPLMGRTASVDNDIPDDFQLGGGSDIAMGGLTGDDEFELYGTAAQVDTQAAAESQWQRSALVGETANFLEFVQNAIDENEDVDDAVTFETLLPPESNSQIVAAQAFLHVLSLGTKGALTVEQEEPFSDLALKIIAASV